MSGPKYYTIDVPNEDVNEVLRRLSKFRLGVSVKVVNGKLEYTVSNDAWMRGVNKSTLTEEVRKVEAEIANDRRLQQMFEEGKLKETKSMEEAKRAIGKEYNDISKEYDDAIDDLEWAMENSVTEISTPFGRIQVSGNKNDIESLMSETKTKSGKLVQIRDSQIRACDDYAKSIREAKTPKEFEKLKKKRPNKTDWGRPSSDIPKLVKEVEARKKRANGISEKLNDLDRQLSINGLDGYRDRIKGKLEVIDLLSADAPRKIDDLLSEIKKENESRIRELQRMENDAKTGDEIERINKELASLEELFRPIKESFSEVSVVNADNTALNEETIDKCSGIIQKIKELGHVNDDLSHRLKTAEGELESCMENVRSADTTTRLDMLSSDLEILKEETEGSAKKRREFEEAREAYREAYARYVAALGQEDEVSKEMKGYDRMVNAVYSDSNASEATEELQDKARKLNELVDEVEKNDQYEMMMGVFSFSSEYISSKKDKEGNVHTYFAKKGDEYKGVIFDAVKGDKIEVVPRRVRLSNGRFIITAKQLDEVHKKCKWSEDMEADCADLGIKLERTEADPDYQKQVCSDNEAVQLDEKETEAYLNTTTISESELASLGYSVNRSTGRVVPKKAEVHEVKGKVQYADR